MSDALSTELITTLLTGAAGGAATAYTQASVEAARDWIRRHIGKYGPDTKRRAEANASEFIIGVANRVQRLEQGWADSGLNASAIQEKMTDPDVAATLQGALQSATRTSDRERHEVLAELVAQRLRAVTGDTEAVTSSVAVDLIPRLSRSHLAFLGLHVGVVAKQHMRVLLGDPASVVDEELSVLPRKFKEAEVLRRIDFQYIASLGCASDGGGVISWPLRDRLQPVVHGGWDAQAFLSRLPTGQWLAMLWENGASTIGVNIVGATIGRQVYRHRMAPP